MNSITSSGLCCAGSENCKIEASDPRSDPFACAVFRKLPPPNSCSAGQRKGGAESTVPDEHRRPVGHGVAGENLFNKLMLDVVLDFELEVVDVGQFRVGADFHGAGNGGGLVFGIKAQAVLAAIERTAIPKNLATQINARYSFVS